MILRTISPFVMAVILVAAAPAQTVVTHMSHGCLAGSSFGKEVAQVADYDGDGIRDYIVAAPGFGMAGAAMIHSSATGAILHRFEGETAGIDFLGEEVADAGDVDGDGVDDVAISATQAQPAGSTGYIVVMSGAHIASNIPSPGTNPCAPPGSALAWITTVSTAGIAGGAEVIAIRGLAGTPGTFGDSLDIRDTDGDGIAEFLIGSTLEPPNGAAWLLRGSDLRTLANSANVVTTVTPAENYVIAHYSGSGPGLEFGLTASFIGDIDGDGDEDFAVGEPGFGGDAGQIHVYSGGSTPTFIQRYGGPANMQRVGGTETAPVGDLNNDGHDDFAVAAVTTSLPGAVFVLDGDLVSQGQNASGNGPGGTFVLPDPHAGPCPTGTVAEPLHACLLGASTGDAFGVSITTADLDGDGAADVVVGAHDAFFGTGDVYVHSGTDLSLSLVLNGNNAGDLFGISVARLDDVNGDGRPEIVVGARDSDIPGVDFGSAVVLSLPTTELNDIAVLHSEQGTSPERLGTDGGSLGDITGDGIPDYAVGADRAEVPGVETGRLIVYDGDTNMPLHVYHGPSPFHRLGRDPTTIGDIDNDGVPDFAVSAPRSGSTGALNGSVYVISGAHAAVPGTTVVSNAANSGAELLVFHGMGLGGRLGYKMANLGDLDGDGFDELGLSTQSGAAGMGEVYVIRGAGMAGAIGSVFAPLMPGDGIVMHYLVGTEVAAEFGHGLANVGFVDGDAFPDFAVGEPYTADDAGLFKVYSGFTGAPIMTYTAPGCGRLGISITGLGDQNADGRDEFAVSGVGLSGFTFGNVWVFDGLTVAQSQPFGGTVTLGDPQLGPCGSLSVPGQPVYRCIPGGGGFELFGNDLAGLDLDGDSNLDLAIGTPVNQTGRVEVYSLSGSVDLLLRFNGVVTGDQLGNMVASLGDRNSDARDDLLVGIHLSDQAGVDAGAFLILGANAPYDGSNEDYIQVSGIDEAPNGIAVKDAPANVPVLLNYSVETPGDTWVGENFLIIAEAFSTGTPPTTVPGFPELHLDPSNLFILFNSAGQCVPSPFGGPPICPSLPPDRIDFSWGIPMGPPNMSVLIQSVVITPQANNGFFVTSPAHEIRFQ